jgi:hypothetical protein
MRHRCPCGDEHGKCGGEQGNSFHGDLLGEIALLTVTEGWLLQVMRPQNVCEDSVKTVGT